jgi:hypothetical protein
MIMSRYLIGAAVLLLTVPAMAESPSYNFIQAGYQEVDLDIGGGPDVDGDGWALGGSFEFGEDFFGFVSYADTGFDFSVDLTQLQVGIGWKMDVSDNTNFFARAAYVDAEIDAPGFGSFDESGYGVGIGIRSNVTDLIELYGEIAYVDLGSGADTTSVGGGIYFNLTDNFALGLGASTDDDATAYGANVRFYFGS